MRAAVGLASIVASGLATAGAAHAQTPDDLAQQPIVFARGAALYKSDAKGKTEVELVALPAKVAVRALRTDADATVLLVDLGGKWSWMPLDGVANTLVELPCADGPAQLATDGRCVLCRSAKQPDQSIIVNLKSGRHTPVQVPAPGARLVGRDKDRRLVWADKAIWSAPPGNPAKKTQVAPEAPLRGLLPSPDGSRAVGVYLVEPELGSPGAKAKPAELLMGFALDGTGARRKGIRAGVPVEWSHDNQWVLIQDGSAACIMRAIGGEYKCWRGYTAASIAPDGSYALLLGSATPAKKPGAAKPAAKPAPKAEPAKLDPIEDTEAGAGAPPLDDVAVPPPTGPLSLYRAKLDGAYTDPPQLIVKVVDGAAVWIPRR